MKRVSRARIQLAKVPKKKRAKKGQQKEELVDNCDCCGQAITPGRLRTIGSAVITASDFWGGISKTIAIFRQNKKPLFACSDNCHNSLVLDDCELPERLK